MSKLAQAIETDWIGNIQKLPPRKLIAFRALSDAQQFQWSHSKKDWHYLGSYLEYKQFKQAGYLPDNPLDKLPTVFKDTIEIEGNVLLAELDLMIEGWEIIKATAIQEGRNFSFDCPRDLFVESCKQEAEFRLKHTLSNEYNVGDSLTEVREYFRQSNAFYRDRLEGKIYLAWMKAHKDCTDWNRFSIYALWEYRKNILRKQWKNYLDAYKTLVAMVCDKNFFTKYGVVQVQLNWNNGHAVDSKNKRPIKFPSCK